MNPAMVKKNVVMNRNNTPSSKEDFMNTNTVGFSVKGAVNYSESIEVSDERTLELVRKLHDVFVAFEAPPRGKKRGSAAPETEPDLKPEPGTAPDVMPE